MSILLAIYNPHELWFSELLHSINSQTYTNIEILVWDDCPEKPIDESILENAITNFPYILYRGEKNLGTTKAFEELSKLGNGKYFSFCDQDDIWFPNKTAILVETLEKTCSTLVCSDMYVIDANGKVIANSISKVHKRHTFKEGSRLAVSILSKNFVTGCASLVYRETIQKALPFCSNFVHDQWIAAIAALYGHITVIKQPLLKYRRHSSNQTGLLNGIADKSSFYKMRIDNIKNGVQMFITKLNDIENPDINLLELKRMEKWSQARANYFHKPNIKDFITICSFENFDRYATYFELATPFMPNFLFNFVLKQIKKRLV